MKEVGCVHSMGVSSHSSNTLGCQCTVPRKKRNVGAMLLIEQIDTPFGYISPFSAGSLKSYLLCHFSLNWTLYLELE